MSVRTWFRGLVLPVALFIILSGCTSSEERVNQQLLSQFETELQSLLDAWYPVSVDTAYGGFVTDLSVDWQPKGPQNKMLVTQARHVWTTSQAAMFTGNDYYAGVAEHGYHYLRDVMYDPEYGGFFLFRDQQGNPLMDRRTHTPGNEKTAYSMAFVIYALSSYYEMSGDKAALDLAIETFHWLDEHSHDSEYGGYVNELTREGEWYGKAGMYRNARRGLGRDNKDQNSSIHILEAFTELYKVWPDDHLRARLNEMLEIIRDKIVGDKGYLTMFLELDWTPISFRDSSEAVRKANYYYDNVSFGHDVETAFLMLETSHVLGIKDDAKTLSVAKQMVDHCLANGMDPANGSIYYEGYYFKNSDTCTIVNDSRDLWVQAEGCNAFLLMHNLFPKNPDYYPAFIRIWDYIQANLIDRENGGWYPFGIDTDPQKAKSYKASIWQANYHNARSLMNCIRMLRGESELVPGKK